VKFSPFCKRIGVKLTRAQRVLCAVAFDGAEPGAFSGEDRDVARQLFGDIETIPLEARHVLTAVCGARGGKSYVLIALRMLHLALTVSLETLAPGEIASAIIVAPDIRLARQALRYAIGASQQAPELKALVSSVTSDSFVVSREGGRTVVVECLPATRGGSALRGRSLVGAALDEAAFFRDENSVVNDSEVFKALAPRVMVGGQIVIASTPWSEAGILHDLFSTNHGQPTTAIAAHAPTTLLRDDERTRSMVERERQRDPDNARREFDAVFMPAGSGFFFDASVIDAAVVPDAVFPLPHRRGATASVAADLAFNSDYSACAAVYRSGEKYEIADLLELRPEKNKPLKPSAVVREFAQFARARGASDLGGDSHYKETARELLYENDLGFIEAPGGQTGKLTQYLAMRTLLNDRKLSLPNHPRLIAQLKGIIARPTPGGGLSISAPRRPGQGHSDACSAVVLAVYLATKYHATESASDAEKPRFGTQEYWTWYHSPEQTQAREDEVEARESAELPLSDEENLWDSVTKPFWERGPTRST
jgi:hypothetical protein